MNKRERKKLYKLAKHYSNVVACNMLRARQLKAEGKIKQANELNNKLIGIGQYATDFLDLLKCLKIPFEVLQQEFDKA